MLRTSITRAIYILNKKEVIAYPTEAVFGLGCDPDSKTAIDRLIRLKKRKVENGFILIAADYIQLSRYIDDTKLTQSQWDIIFSTWPGPVTFVLPAKKKIPRWLTGSFNSLAVRITNHPLIVKLCLAFGKPLVSTSANFSGKQPCRTVEEVLSQFGEHFPVVNGKLGGRHNPSEIRNIITGEILRYG